MKTLMNLDQRMVVAVAAFTVFAIVGLVFARRGRSVVTENETVQGFNFHPDMVRKLTWIVPSAPATEETFSRASRNQKWSPQVPTEQIQTKLNVLATLFYRPIQFSKKSLTSLTLEFAPENSWSADFDGENLVWTAGLLKGKGIRLDNKNKSIFLEGHFAFQKLTWSLCDGRPERIDFRSGSSAFNLEARGLDWMLKTTEAGATHERKVDPTSVEHWLGAHCQVTVQLFRDLKLFPVARGAYKGMLSVTFTDHHKIEVPFNQDSYLISQDAAIRAADLTNALAEIQEFKAF